MERAARWAISVMFFADGAALGSWAPHIATVQHRLHLTPAVLGLALLASPIGAVLTMPFAGYAISHFGSRVTALVGGLVLCAVLPFLLLSNSLLTLVIPLFVLGVFNGQMDVGMNAHSLAVQKLYPKPILSSVHGWFSVGGFAGGAGAALSSFLGIEPAVHLAIAGALLAILLVTCFPRLLPAKVDQNAEGPRFALPAGPLLWLAILAFVAFLSEGAVWDWAAVYLRNILGSTAAVGAIGFATFSIAMAGGRFIGDELIHRFGRGPVFRSSALAASGGLLLALLLPSATTAIIGFAAVGFGLANVVPILFNAAGTVPGVSAATGLAAVTTCGYTAFFVGPPLIGLVAGAQSLSFALGSIALLCLAMILGARRAGIATGQ